MFLLILSLLCAFISVVFGGFAIYFGNKVDDFLIFKSRIDEQDSQIESCKKSIKSVRSCLTTDCSGDCYRCSYYRDMNVY